MRVFSILEVERLNKKMLTSISWFVLPSYLLRGLFYLSI